MKTLECSICKKPFTPIKGNQIVCFNEDCRKEKKRICHVNEKISKGFHVGYKNRKCTICGKEYKPTTSRQKSCSEECQLLLNRQLKNKLQKKYNREKIKTDINYIERRKIRLLVGRIIKGKKKMHSIDMVGYTPEEFIESIESKFLDGMTWDNYGEWHIDHIKPLTLFHFAINGEIDYEEIKKSMSLDNLQPLWAHDNLSKGARYENPCS